jgi:hypothetical protein
MSESQTAAQPWRHPIEQCDVQDRAKLEAYRASVPVWSELLNGEDDHSVSAQLSDMFWQDAAWRSVNEARRFTSKSGPSAAVSSVLRTLLDRGYIAGQILSIAKLLDPSDAKRPQRAVVSLRRLVDEISAARDLFTREVFICHDGLPYDWEAARTRDMAKWVGHEEGGVYSRWLDTDGPDAWAQSELMHRSFDALSGISADRRQRTDTISSEVFDRLSAALADPVFEDVLSMRNKTIAHAADAFSRSQATGLRSGLKLDEIAHAQRKLLGVSQALSASILYGAWRGSAVPTPQYDQFEYLELPFVHPEHMGDLHNFWREHCKSRDEWLQEAFYEIIPKVDR